MGPHAKKSIFTSDKIDIDETKEEEKASAKQVLELKQYAKKYYDYPLSGKILQQLALFQANSPSTPESNVRLADKKEDIVHLEVKRALARLNCLQLLLDGSPEAKH